MKSIGAIAKFSPLFEWNHRPSRVGLYLIGMAICAGCTKSPDVTPVRELSEEELRTIENERLHLKGELDRDYGGQAALFVKNSQAVLLQIGADACKKSAAEAESRGEEASLANACAGFADLICAGDAACLESAREWVKLQEDEQRLAGEMGKMTKVVGNRIYLANQCEHPIVAYLTYQNLHGDWVQASRFPVPANTSAFATVNDAFLRSHSGKFYVYAETTDEQPTLQWSGAVPQTFENVNLLTVERVIEADRAFRYPIDFTCPPAEASN